MASKALAQVIPGSAWHFVTLDLIVWKLRYRSRSDTDRHSFERPFPPELILIFASLFLRFTTFDWHRRTDPYTAIIKTAQHWYFCIIIKDFQMQRYCFRVWQWLTSCAGTASSRVEVLVMDYNDSMSRARSKQRVILTRVELCITQKQRIKKWVRKVFIAKCSMLSSWSGFKMHLKIFNLYCCFKSMASPSEI